MAAPVSAAAKGRRSRVDGSATTFYLLRHGQTVWNVEGRGQGRRDSPLTTLGVQQAQHHRQTLAALPLTRAYVSPMGRALTTARLALEGLGVPLTVLDDLAEVDMGKVAGLLPSERLARFPLLAEVRKRDKYRTVMPGGESYETASPRVARALQHIQEDGPGHVLIVSHEMIGRLLRMHLLGLTPEQAMTLRHPQDTIYRIEAGQLTMSVGGQPFQSHPPSPRP
ncbi:histidine phosphatase family protein [Deinococcus marmoris]|uniref:histidine phosphatase family protein n=1 Tax=Deinococcus marmoris TaxID=249408 RepID=UPI00096AC3D6|nr:histidine phosphatase family protein [Deinococcus marmoris]